MKILKELGFGLVLGWLFFIPLFSEAACVPVDSNDHCSNMDSGTCLQANLCEWSGSDTKGSCKKVDACVTLKTESTCKGDPRCKFTQSSTANSGTSNTSNATGGAASTPLKNPLGKTLTSPQLLIGNIINSVLGIVGSIALLMFIYGGFTWLTSGGSAENIKKGKDIIIWATIGMAVIFLSYGLVKFLILNIR